MADYYSLLGISKNATDAEIKAAYRKQALKWHPDRNKTPEATEKFKEINKAFEVLNNPSKRQMYDQYGEQAFQRGNYGSGAQASGQGPFTYTYTNFGGEGNPFEGADFGGFSDPFDIFESFFGASGFGRSARSRQRREIYELSLTFDEAVHGVQKEAVIKGKTKMIKIPAGVDDGMRIRFTDFDIQVRVHPSKTFKREGQDVYVEKVISFSTAVLGGTVDVETIDGNVTLRVRPGTPGNSMIRLGGKGIVYPQSNRRGDQYVIYKIKVPDRVSSRAKQLLKELNEELS